MEITGSGMQIPLKAPEENRKSDPPPPRQDPPPELEGFQISKAKEPGKGQFVDFTV